MTDLCIIPTAQGWRCLTCDYDSNERDGYHSLCECDCHKQGSDRD